MTNGFQYAIMMETVDNYQKAVEYFDRKDFTSAKNILDGLLAENPADIDALNFLGIIMLNFGRYDEALSYLKKVISIYEPHPIAHYNIGLCRQHFRELEAACSHYKRAVELKPDYVDAINNLGVTLLDLKEYSEAEKYFNVLLIHQPKNAMAYNNRGNLFYHQDKLDLAEIDYQTALHVEPDNPEFNFNLGNCYLQQKEFDEALKYFHKCLELNPNNTLAYNNIGLTLFKLHRFNEAETYFQKALNKDPDNAEVHFNLAGCYRELGESDSTKEKLENAINYYNKAVEIDPNLKGALVNIGNIYKKLGNETEAHQYFDKVAEDKSAKVIAFTNLGVLRMGLGLIDESLEYFNLAIKADNSITEPHYNKSHALLISGNFAEGWKEYEWRKKRKEFHGREFSKPELVPGIDIQGKRILVYDEQGIGDSIQFVRFVPMLLDKGAKVLLECNELLFDLYKGITEGIELIKRNAEKEPIEDYDYQIPILSLPLYFNLTIEDFNTKSPYLFADSLVSKKMSGLIGKGEELKVGIVWAGNPNHSGDFKRSCRLSHFEALSSIRGIKLVSLQKGNALQQANENNFPVVVLDEYLNTFMDTAGAIENLDLIITVDTSVAHLAGAMGKPVWLLLPFFPDWRWMLGRNDSPWYPSMRLFRQVEDGNWNLVFDEVLNSLENMKMQQINNNEIVNRKLSILTDDYHKESETKKGKLFLGLTRTGDYGWGTVNKYIKKELSKRIEVKSMGDNEFPALEELNQAKIFQLVKDLDFNPLFDIRAKENYGYAVFENELTPNSIENSKLYTKIVTASTWNYEKLKAAGIHNAGLAIQGVDTEMFYPDTAKRSENLFVIFSGGKFEIRKGQDIILKAVSILQKKYPDIILLNAWYNAWIDSMRLMRFSNFMKYDEKGSTWDEFMNNIYYCNDIDPQKVFTLPLVPNKDLRQVYLKSDIGLFPNRCEGGTNLVMMEYMACGKPVIGSYNTGQKDVLTDNNCLLLKQMKEFKLFDSENWMFADWEEPSLDEIIEKIEFAYHNRETIKKIGMEGAQSMKKFAWSKTAENIIKEVGL